MPLTPSKKNFTFFQKNTSNEINCAYSDTDFSVMKSIGFIRFVRKKCLNAPNNQNWKFHFSIHPDDLMRAWDEVFWPILQAHADSFKVPEAKHIHDSLIKNSKILKKARQDLERVTHEYPQFLKDNDPVKHSDLLSQINTLLEKAQIVHSQYRKAYGINSMEYLSTISNSVPNLDKNKLKYALVTRYLNGVIKDATEGIQEFIRMLHGMQVTVYIPWGEHVAYQEMAKKIEAELIKKGVRPGYQYLSDMAMGRYCSRRHPGIYQYHNAVTVGHYNPDNVKDPFKPILNADLSLQAIPRVNRQNSV